MHDVQSTRALDGGSLDHTLVIYSLAYYCRWYRIRNRNENMRRVENFNVHFICGQEFVNLFICNYSYLFHSTHIANEI